MAIECVMKTAAPFGGGGREMCKKKKASLMANLVFCCVRWCWFSIVILAMAINIRFSFYVLLYPNPNKF